MKKEEILKQLNEYLESSDIVKLLSLKEKLTQDVKETNFVTKPSQRKKLNAIKRVLNNKQLDCRPLLKAFCRYENGVAFTDSYHLFKLNDEYLPFNVAMTKNDSESDIKEYAQKHGIDITSGVYPNLDNIIPSDKVDEIEIDINEMLAFIKTTPKDGNKILYNFKSEECGEMCLDATYIKNAIDILGLDKNFKIELYGNYRPVIIRNDNEEFCLICPIKTY